VLWAAFQRPEYAATSAASAQAWATDPTQGEVHAATERRERRAQADLLRDIFGNPFRPVTFNPAWRSVAAVKLAQAIYQERAFDRLPILADALEEAGCTDAEILTHCRGGGEHVRGCWLVDLVLAEEGVTPGGRPPTPTGSVKRGRLTPVLRIIRPRRVGDLFLPYQLFVDGACVGAAWPGSELEVQLPPGRYDLVARIDCYSSNTLAVELEQGRTLAVEVGSNVRGWRALLGFLYLTVMRSRYLYLRRA
jgi:hypothetical protein